MTRKKIGKVSQKVININDAYTSNVEPSGDALRDNMLWIDTSVPSAEVLKQYNGSGWDVLPYDFQSSTPVNSDKDIEDYVLTLGNISNDDKINYYERLKLKDVFQELFGDNFLNTGGGMKTFDEIILESYSATVKPLLWTINYYASEAFVSVDDIKTRYAEFKNHMELYTSPSIFDTNVANKFSDITISDVTAYRSVWTNLITAIKDASILSQDYWSSYSISIKGMADETPNRNMLRNGDFYIKDNETNKPLGAWKDFYQDNGNGTSVVVDISTDINGIDFKNSYRIVGQSGLPVGIMMAPISVVESEIRSYNGKTLSFSAWKKANNITGDIDCRVVIIGEDAGGMPSGIYYPLVTSQYMGWEDTDFASVQGNTGIISIPSSWTEVTGMYFDLYLNGGTGSLEITGMKLEESNYPTKWIPNNLDFDERVKGSTFTMTPDGITSMVFDSTQWSTFSQKVDSLEMEVATNAGEIARIELKADIIESTVTDNTGLISSISQRADIIESVVNSNSGLISSISQRADSIESTVSNHTGLMSSISQRADIIESVVNSNSGLISSISQKADRIDIVVGYDDEINANAIASAIALNSSAIDIISENINLYGKVTFYSFDNSLQDEFYTTASNANFAMSTADAANSTANIANNKATAVDNKVIGLGNSNSATKIHGGNIITGTISANVISTGTLSSLQINNGNGAFTVNPSGQMTATNVYISSSSSGYDNETNVYQNNSVNISNGAITVQQYGGNSSSTQTINISGNTGIEFKTTIASSSSMRIDVYETESSYYTPIYKIHAMSGSSSILPELRLVSAGSIYARSEGADMHLAGRYNSNQNYGHLYLTSTTSGGFVMSPSMYEQTTTSSANLYIQSSGHIKRNTSSIRYKINVEEQDISRSKMILDLKPKTWHDKNDSERYADYLTAIANGEDVPDGEWKQCDKLRRIGGLIAEEVEAVGLKEYVTYEDDGVTTNGLMYDRLWTLLIPIVKEHEDKVQSLENRIAQLEAIINSN